MEKFMLKDKDIREPLFEYFEERYPKVRIIEEKTMGRSRADIMMVLPDCLIGVEIKSDADTYARLERQTKDYDLFFDANIIVVGSKHAKHVQEHVPEWWGIISVEEQDDKVDFYVVRQMKKNPKVEMKQKIILLWRRELSHIQELNGMPAYKNKSKNFVREKVIDTISEEILQEQLCQELFERDYTTIEDEIAQYRMEHNRPKRRKRKKRRTR